MDTDVQAKVRLTLGLWGGAAFVALLIRRMGHSLTIPVPSGPITLSVVLAPALVLFLVILWRRVAALQNWWQSTEGTD